MPVHLYGHACDMKSICDIARKYKLFVLEDCAEAIGTTINGQRVGSFGDISAFSFFGNKSITTGEGGMVLTMMKHFMDVVCILRGKGLLNIVNIGMI